jgi:hypothetical protein
VIGRVLNLELRILLKRYKIAHIPASFQAHLKADIGFRFLGEELGSLNFLSAVGRATVLQRLGRLTGTFQKRKAKGAASFGTSSIGQI